MKLPCTLPGADKHSGDAPLLAEIVAGLSAPQKYLHPKFFYDARGAELFDRICEQPEYYLTATETSILQAHAPAFVKELGSGIALIELGSGAGIKTRILLDALQPPSSYVPVDISSSQLKTVARLLAQRYPRIDILPVCADFTQPFAMPTPRNSRRSVVFFPGSTIGNYYRPEAVELLRLIARLMGNDGLAIVGTDLRKDPAILERAYNDHAGVTAEFNLNLLARLNREFGANFNLKRFTHDAHWVPAGNRIEMHLVSLDPQTVDLAGHHFTFAAGETIWTESCHKYSPEQFEEMACEAGLSVMETWTDAQRLFGVQILRGR